MGEIEWLVVGVVVFIIIFLILVEWHKRYLARVVVEDKEEREWMISDGMDDVVNDDDQAPGLWPYTSSNTVVVGGVALSADKTVKLTEKIRAAIKEYIPDDEMEFHIDIWKVGKPWEVYHSLRESIPEPGVKLSGEAGEWNDTAPTSTKFEPGGKEALAEEILKSAKLCEKCEAIRKPDSDI